MPRKHKQKLKPAKFSIGTEIQVKSGVHDPEWPEFPLGGWVGTIKDVGDASPRTYLIEWNQETLNEIHPVYRQRCERDELDVEETWLLEGDLELNTGEVVPIEQPAEIKVRPLRKYNQEDRIRAALGLTSDDLLPTVHQETLAKYHRHLTEQMAFPFKIWQDDEKDATVLGLLDIDECNVEDGLMCHVVKDGEDIEKPLADLELVSGGKNRQLIEDYSFWLWHFREGDDEAEPVTLKSLLANLLQAAILGSLAGAAVGAVWNAYEDAGVAIRTGAGVLALVGGFRGIGRSWMNAVLGAAFGGVLGGLLGAMLMAWIGALLGAVSGFVLGIFVFGVFKWVPAPIFGLLGGSLLGIGVQAWQYNTEAAQTGLWIGGIAGAIAGPILVVGLSAALSLWMERES